MTKNIYRVPDQKMSEQLWKILIEAVKCDIEYTVKEKKMEEIGAVNEFFFDTLFSSLKDIYLSCFSFTCSEREYTEAEKKEASINDHILPNMTVFKRDGKIYDIDQIGDILYDRIQEYSAIYMSVNISIDAIAYQCALCIYNDIYSLPAE